MRRRIGRHPALARGALAGLVGGLIASFVMNRFQAALAKVKAKKDEVQPRDEVARHGAQQQKALDSNEEPATVKAAVAVSGAVLHCELRPEEKESAGNLVHYLFGTVSGGLYGIFAEKTPAAQAGFGTLFGSVLWLLSDEVAVPAFGLAKASMRSSGCSNSIETRRRFSGTFVPGPSLPV